MFDDDVKLLLKCSKMFYTGEECSTFTIEHSILFYCIVEYSIKM